MQVEDQGPFARQLELENGIEIKNLHVDTVNVGPADQRNTS